MKNGSIWHGNEKDGIELRYQEGDLDEVVLYVDGKCKLHIERMDDTVYWMSIESKKHKVHLNIASKNGRSYVDASAEGWPLVKKRATHG